MLTMLTRKLCPLMSLAIATIGCGKKISESDAAPARQTENQEMPSAYVIRLDGSDSSKKQYLMPLNTQFEVPDVIRVRSGSAINKVVEIAYDVNPYDSEDFQFKCVYKPAANPTSEMVREKCVNYDGDDFGNINGYRFTLYRNDIVEIKFAGAQAKDLSVEAIYSMRWL